MNQVPHASGATFDELMSVVRQLRDPIYGCPWDREQTHVSLIGDLIEEAYEVIEAIETGDIADLIEELGDLLLQVTHHIGIAEENQGFSAQDVFSGIVNKLIRRHPHVFSANALTSPVEVLQQWERIKQEERKHSESTNTPFSGLPRAMPALVYAQKTQVRVSSLGLDWGTILEPLGKIQEELSKVMEANSVENQQTEIGDLLFSVVNAARWMGIDAEAALRSATNRFQERTEVVTTKAREEHIDLLLASSEEKARLWDIAKSLVSSED